MTNFAPQTEGYIMCQWCKQFVGQSSHCSNCKLLLKEPENISIAPSKPDKKPKRDKPTRSPELVFRKAEGKITVLGIDPGARYTGVIIRDNDIPIYSSIFVRPIEMSGTDWALETEKQCIQVYNDFKPDYVAIEGISDPKGFYKGEQAAINPKDIIRTGIVLGALVSTWPTATIVKPGANGDLDDSFYPSSLNGRRPKELLGTNKGANTRKHEKSAYDVAGKAMVELGILKEL